MMRMGLTQRNGQLYGFVTSLQRKATSAGEKISPEAEKIFRVGSEHNMYREKTKRGGEKC